MPTPDLLPCPFCGERVGVVDQIGDSDCFAACLSALTGRPLADVPHWSMADTVSAGRWPAVLRFLWGRGWNMAVDFAAPAGIAVAHGKSPRGEWGHSVLYKNGQPWHDPHPSRAYLAGPVESYTVVWRRAPTGGEEES